jgi:hypothetical protein
MKIKKNILWFACFSFTCFIFACKKDNLDFNKFNGYTPNPEFGIPLVNATLGIKDLTKNNPDNIKTDNDGLIRFTIREDSIISYNLGDLFKLDQQSGTTINKSIGEISIDDVTTRKQLTLGELSQGFSPAVKANFNLIENTTNVFPAVNENISNITSFGSISEFSSIKFSKGWLVLSITNKLPVNINQIRLNLYNQTPTQTLLGTFNFLNILKGTVKSDSIQINNKQISSNMGYTMPIYNSASSGTPVFINSNDSIVITMFGRQLKAISGSAVFPSQDVTSQSTYLDLTTSDLTQQIRKLKITNGSLRFVAKSTVSTDIQLSISFPNATKNGNTFPSQNISIPTTGPNNSILDSIDISGVQFDLTRNTLKPYNSLPIAYTIKLLPSNNIENFDSSNYVDLQVLTSGISVDYAEGFFGDIKVAGDSIQPIDISFFDKISEGLKLDDPKLALDIYSSIGVPIKFNYDFTGSNSNSKKTQPMQMPSFELAYPQVIDIGTSSEIRKTTQVVDKTNSKIVDFVALAPNKITCSGNVLTNVGHSPSETQYISSKSAMSVNMSMDLPAGFYANNLTLVDTFEFGLDVFNNFKQASIMARVDNGFPFGTKINMVFLDTANKAVDSVAIDNLLMSAITDANGRTIQRGVSKFELPFNEARIATLNTAKVKKIKLVSTLATENQGGKVVRIYSDYDLKISLGIIGKVSTK